jgi:hypothetical protein
MTMDINEIAKRLVFEEITDSKEISFKAGDIVKHEDGYFELVGDINENGGYTDDSAEPRRKYVAVARDAFGQLLKLMKGGSGNELS